MKECIIASYNFNLKYAIELVKDIPDKIMAFSFGDGLENHPAFTLGHLCVGAAMTARYLGGPYSLPEGWEALFKRMGPGDPRLPDSDHSKYPKKEILLMELKKQHQIVESLLGAIPDAKLMEPKEWKLSGHLPRLADLVHYMCITHEANHLGQIAAWRRALKMDSALKRLRSDFEE